ncbi:MAG: TatD family hydrolase [bacterium]|nr:TatD family hydrolase [bacterium]
MSDHQVIEIIDTHCHLDDKAFNEDRVAVWERAQAADVVAIVNPASNLDDSRATVKLAHETVGVFAAIGIHPHAAVEMNAQKLAEAEKVLGELSKDQTVVAIGEFGFDSKNGSTEAQKPAVQMLLKLARAQELPIILHCRDLYKELFATLDEAGSKHTGVVHSFTGGPAELEQILKRGLHVAFGGIVTFDKKTEQLREAAMQCPLDRMLLETDSPYLTPVPRRGRRNEPAEVATICDFIAKLRGISYAELARATTQNARRLFSLPDGLGARKTQ